MCHISVVNYERGRIYADCADDTDEQQNLEAHVFTKYYAVGEDTDDLLSIGTIGSIKAIGTYKPDKGVSRSSYASRCIENVRLLQTVFMAKINPEV